MSLQVVELAAWNDQRVWRVQDVAGPFRSRQFYGDPVTTEFWRSVKESTIDFLYWRHGEPLWRRKWHEHGEQLVNEMPVIERVSADRPTVDSGNGRLTTATFTGGHHG